MTEYHLKSPAILKAANEIFGGIVKDAYVEHYHKKELAEIVERYEREKREKGELGFDAKAIILVFQNGNKVKLWNSEWGGMSLVNELNTY